MSSNIRVVDKIKLILFFLAVTSFSVLVLVVVLLKFKAQYIHADYESPIYVPNYAQLDKINNTVSPKLIVGIGPQVEPKVESNKNKPNNSNTSMLIARVSAKYKSAQNNILTTKTKKIAKPKKSRPDWYMSKFPKSRREYLLKVRPKKVAWLKAFFTRYNSPLKANVYDFVYASEYYGIDYRLLPAISIVESSGGKYLFRPYNPFGWGKRGYRNFKEAIWDVARGLSVYHYRLKRTTPETIGQLYNPVTPTHWARKVRYLMSLMPKY